MPLARSGDGRARIRDVADRAGVSMATVSRILNGSYPASPKTRQRVMEAVEELDYVANPHARALIARESGTVAIVVTMIDEGLFGTMVQTIASRVSAEERLCLIGTTGPAREREMAVLKQMRSQQVDVVVLIGGVIDNDDYRRQMTAYAKSLQDSGIRLILCARPAIGPGAPAAVVEYDNAGGAYAAISHLLTRGHRRILCLGGPENHTTTLSRLAGQRQALKDLGGDSDPRLEVLGTFSKATGYAAVSRILAAGPPSFTAIFAWNDGVAAGAMQALREAGLRVPDDMSIVGFDDTEFAADIQLTTVHIPARELGNTAATLALNPGDSHDQIMIGTHVVIRDSVRSLNSLS